MRCVRVMGLRCRVQISTVKGSLRRLVRLLLLLTLLKTGLGLLLLLLLGLEIHHQRVVVARVQDIGWSRGLNRRELAVGAPARARSSGASWRDRWADATVGLETVYW